MDNEKIATLLSTEAFLPHDENSLGYAIQLFIEKVVLPNEVEDYSIDDIRKYILKFLETR